MEQGSKITVVVRKRPLGKKELARGEQDIVDMRDVATVVVKEIKQKVDLTKYVEEHNFNFDLAFDQLTTNEQVYATAVRPIIEAAFNRAKVTCFAYGQTGSGKTHTMIGDAEAGNPGLYLLASYDIFSLLQQPQFSNLHLTISFYEIYCNKLQDLLNEKAQLQPREDAKGNVNIVGLSERKVTNVSQLMQIIQLGQGNRVTGSNSANSESSRSHALLQINLKQGKHLHGKLSFIDLAGSERGADVQDQNKQTRIDGAEINKSLLALKECIRAIDLNKNHTPFRGSKLTLVLKDSFTGNCRTVMIGNISPSNASSEHTLNTLRYADRVKELKKPQEGGMSQQDYLAKELMLARQGNNVVKKAYKHPDDESDEEEEIFQQNLPRQNQQGHQGLTKMVSAPPSQNNNPHQQMLAQMANMNPIGLNRQNSGQQPQPFISNQNKAPISQPTQLQSMNQNSKPVNKQSKAQPQPQVQPQPQPYIPQQMNFMNQQMGQPNTLLNQQQINQPNQMNPQQMNQQQQQLNQQNMVQQMNQNMMNPYGNMPQQFPQNQQQQQLFNQQQQNQMLWNQNYQNYNNQPNFSQQGQFTNQQQQQPKNNNQTQFQNQQNNPQYQQQQYYNNQQMQQPIRGQQQAPSYPNLGAYQQPMQPPQPYSRSFPSFEQQPYIQQQVSTGYSNGLTEEAPYDAKQNSFTHSSTSDQPDQLYQPQSQQQLDTYIDYSGLPAQQGAELTPQQIELQQLSSKHEELVQLILQEEEEVVNSHREQIDKMVEITKEEMQLLNRVEQPGSDIQNYVLKLHSMLDEKISFINLLKSKLIDFTGHLKEEETLSKKFYEQRQNIMQVFDVQQHDDMQLLDNLENFNDQY